MAQYIDKDSLVAEIEKRKHRNVLNEGAFEEDIDILSFINTLKVKEMNIEKEIIDWWNTHYSSKDYAFEEYSGHYFENSTLIEIAKHFFELGLKTKQTTI